MELSDINLIHTLVAAPASPVRRSSAMNRGPRVPKGRHLENLTARTRTQRRYVKPCKCGACAQCLDNAKWERIFNEKFADPDYYAPRPVERGSSLGWLRS